MTWSTHLLHHRLALLVVPVAVVVGELALLLARHSALVLDIDDHYIFNLNGFVSNELTIR